MTHRKISWTLAGLGVLGILFVAEAFSQVTGGPPPGPGGPGGPGGGGFRGQFDPNVVRAFSDPNLLRKMATDWIQQALGATDEEWTILEPKVEKVMMLSIQVRGGARGMMVIGFFGPSGAEPSDLMKAQQALTQVLAKRDASPGDINDALKALRAARAKAKAELDKAQADLKDVLSLRQEAQLVQMGMLD